MPIAGVLRACPPTHSLQAMTLIANFLLDHKLDGKPLYLHGMSSGATFALKLPRELQARQADLERCSKEKAVTAKSQRGKSKKPAARSRRDLLGERRSVQEVGGGEDGLGSISCKELPAYQFPSPAKMKLILRQLRGIISSEPGEAWGTCTGTAHSELHRRAESCSSVCSVHPLPIPDPLPLPSSHPPCLLPSLVPPLLPPAVSTPEPSNWNVFQDDNRKLMPGLDLPPIVFVAMSNDTYGAQQAPVHAVLLRRNGIPATSVTVRGAGRAMRAGLPACTASGVH